MNRALYLLPIFLLGLWACQSPDHGHDHGPDSHGHDHGALVASHTLWTDKTELFVEFKPLVVGQTSTFAAHFTELGRFKAVEEGKVTASLIKGGKGIRQTVDSPSAPGLFKPALQPKEKGVYQLVFDIQTPTFEDRIVLEGIQVYESSAEANAHTPHHEEEPNEIAFGKEQAWRIDFANAPARRDTIFEVIHAGGELVTTQGNEKTVSATSEGILVFKKRGANIGSRVSKGETLFAIAGGGIIDRDLEARFLKAKSTFEQAQTRFDRKSELYAAKAISKTELEAAELAFQLAKTEYETLTSNYSKGGKSVFSPQGGYLKQLFKQEGAFVEAGEALAVITENKTVTLRADVDPEYYGRLSAIHSANFISHGKVHSLAELNGKLLSYGKSVSREQPKVPVYFELANTGDLLPGSFVEVFIQLRAQSQGLLIPTSALLEEYGNYSVIVQTSGETFEERNVKIGIENGKEVQVLSGLKAGERVVTKGAYQVKMAAMDGAVPAHGHSH